MSFGIDVNILLYASDRSSPLNQKAIAFLDKCANDREVFCLAWLTLMSYLRMATHPSLFERPLAPEEAHGNVNALLAIPYCRVISETEGFWNAYRDITAAVPARGNLVPDAHLDSRKNLFSMARI